MATPNKDRHQAFDPAKLQSMAEPLLLRVVKLKGSVQQPIELPSKDGGAPGAGWTRDEILSFEQWLVNKWSGGGHYRATLLDSKNPPSEMTWEFLFDPRVYPERVPPNASEAAVMGNTPTNNTGPQLVPANVQPLTQAVNNTSWPPSGNALGYGTPPQSGITLPSYQQQQNQPQILQPVAQPTMPWQQAPQGPSPWGFSGPAPSFYPPPQYGYQQSYTRTRDELRDRVRGNDDDYSTSRQRKEREAEEQKTKELEAKLRAAELLQKDNEYKAQLERMQAQQQQQIQQMQQQQAEQLRAMQEEMRRMAEARHKPEDDEVRRLREETQRLRESAQAEQLKMQQQLMEAHMAQMRAASDQQVAALRDQLAAMSQNNNRGESDEVRQLRAEQDRLRYEADKQREHDRQERERERAETERRLELERNERNAERERYERERRDEMLQRQIKEQADVLERRMQQMAEANNNKGPDPMIEVLRETSRQSGEQMKEMARMNQDQTNRLSNFMLNPLQLAQMMKESSSGQDTFMRNLVSSVDGIVQMYRGAAEQVMQMSGGGGDSPTVRLLQEGMSGVKDTAERFIAMKRDQVISESKVKQAEAQAVAQRAAAEAHVQAEAIRAQSQQTWSPPPPVSQGNGFNGPQPQAEVIPTAVPQRKKPAGRTPAPEVVVAEGPTPVRIEGVPSEPTPAQNANEIANLKMFGAAWESVKTLRIGVKNGLTPSEAVDAILKGVEAVISNNLVIPAFTLFDDSRFADLIDVLFPDGEQAFKDECVRILHEDVELDDSDPEIEGEGQGGE
jgi:hypothetical protein